MITFLTSIFTVNYLSGINITGDSLYHKEHDTAVKQNLTCAQYVVLLYHKLYTII